jgi:hypothetical protein
MLTCRSYPAIYLASVTAISTHRDMITPNWIYAALQILSSPSYRFSCPHDIRNKYANGYSLSPSISPSSLLLHYRLGSCLRCSHRYRSLEIMRHTARMVSTSTQNLPFVQHTTLKAMTSGNCLARRGESPTHVVQLLNVSLRTLQRALKI